MLQNVCENCIRILEEEKHRQLRMFVILWKKVKETGINIDKAKREKPKTVRTPENIAAMAESVCEAPSTYQFTVVLNNWTFRKHHSDEFCIKSLVWCHTKFNWFRSWIQLTIQCVFASLSGPAIDLQKMPILAKKNHLFRWSSFWSSRVYKQTKLLHLGDRKPAHIHWKAHAP